MAQKYYNLEEAAQSLGMSKEQVQHLRESGDMHGYRDGSSWKFKTEDVEKLALERRSGDQPEADVSESADSILLSEVELGESAGDSTIIGKSEANSGGDSDLELASNPDLQIDGSDVNLAAGSSNVLSAATGGSDVLSGSGSAFEDLDELDIDLEGASSKLNAGANEPSGAEKDATSGGDSSVQLASDEDDDLVLGEGSGSDITLGTEDSGISLVDPSDSGLSLDEEPLELGGSSVESLELSDDEPELTPAATSGDTDELASDDDFLLTPLEDSGGEDSGSQVIALDSDAELDEAAAEAAAPTVEAPAMLEEDLGEAAAMPAAALAGVPGLAVAPDDDYSVWNVLSLVLCVVVLLVTGIMVLDLVRNMWSWNEPHGISSMLMDWIVQ